MLVEIALAQGMDGPVQLVERHEHGALEGGAADQHPEEMKDDHRRHGGQQQIPGNGLDPLGGEIKMHLAEDLAAHHHRMGDGQQMLLACRFAVSGKNFAVGALHR